MGLPADLPEPSRLTRRELVARGGLAAGAVALVGARGATARPTAAYKAAARATTCVCANFDVASVFDPESPARGAAPTSETLANLFEPLIAYRMKRGVGGIPGADFHNFEPRLAESWTVSNDRRTYTFKLRKGVKSVYGHQLTAGDYLWSLQRAFNSNSIGKLINTASGVESIDQVKALDDRTLRFQLDFPNALFMHTRTTYLSPIFDSSEVKKHVTPDDPNANKWIGANGGGYGPYYPARVVVGSQTVLNANDEYYRGKARFRQVVVDSLPDAAARLTSLNGGAVDVAEFLDYRQVASLRGSKKAYVGNALPGNANQWLILNTQYEPLRDKRVRQAIAYAVPYEAIVKSIYQGQAQIYKNVIPLSYPNVTTTFWKYDTDLEKAKSLLAAAGRKDGFDVTITYPVGKSEDEQVAIVVGDALGKLGIKATLNKVTAAIFAQMKIGSTKGQSQILVSSGDIPFFPDIVFASLFFFSSNGQFNRGWSNKRLDYLTSKATHETRPSFRTAELYELQKILLDELPYIGIAMTGRPFAFRSDVRGFQWYPDNWLRFYDMSRGG